jgi:hypothetical protein
MCVTYIHTIAHQIHRGPCSVGLTSDDAVPCTGVARVTGESLATLVCGHGSTQSSVSDALLW